jgi:putative flippase GtrA
MNLVLKYSVFSAIAIAINLGSQELSLAIYQRSFALYVSILTGTATGLISKFLLDKIYIFGYRSKSLGDDISKFLAYSLTGIFTTLIFWGFELGFDYVFGNKLMRYIGAVVGLTIGYLIKYQLDKHYVFSTKAE